MRCSGKSIFAASASLVGTLSKIYLPVVYRNSPVVLVPQLSGCCSTFRPVRCPGKAVLTGTMQPLSMPPYLCAVSYLCICFILQPAVGPRLCAHAPTRRRVFLWHSDMNGLLNVIPSVTTARPPSANPVRGKSCLPSSRSSRRGDAYAFIFDQQGLMAGVSIEGTKISRIKR